MHVANARFMLWLLSSTVTFRLLWPASYAVAASPNPSYATQWTPDRVLAALDWREGLLDNCRVSFHSKLSVSDGLYGKTVSDSGAVVADDVTCKMFRRGIAYRYTYSDINDFEPALSVHDAIESWNGRESRDVVPQRPLIIGLTRAGFIDSHLPRLLDYPVPAILLVADLSPVETFGSQIRRLLKDSESQTTITCEVGHGEQLVHVHLEAQNHVAEIRDYWFNPADDFMLERAEFDMFRERPYAGKNPCEIQTFEITKQTRFGELWMPSCVMGIARSYTGDDNRLLVYNRYDGELSSLSLERPTDAQMTVVFPPGLRVVDSVHPGVYNVNADGSKALLPYFDPNTGNAVYPKTQLPSTRP